MKDKKKEDENFMGRGTGTHAAYIVEYQTEDLVWKKAHFERGPNGVPQPVIHGGFNIDHGLLGFEQAMALAWQMKAEHSARLSMETIRIYGVRVVECNCEQTYLITREEDKIEELEVSLFGQRLPEHHRGKA